MYLDAWSLVGGMILVRTRKSGFTEGNATLLGKVCY